MSNFDYPDAIKGDEKQYLKAQANPKIFSCKVAWSFDTYQQMREVFPLSILEVQRKKTLARKNITFKQKLSAYIVSNRLSLFT